MRQVKKTPDAISNYLAVEFEERNNKDLDYTWENYSYGIKKFDDQSLLISSGALAISLTFIKDIVPLKDSIYIGLLYFAIVLFLITIIIGFLSHRQSFKTSRKIFDMILERSGLNVGDIDEIDKIDAEIFNFQQEKAKVIATMNDVTAYSLILGLVLLVLYCVINLAIYKSYTL